MPEKQTRVQVAPKVITWIKANPKVTFTLGEISEALGFHSSSVSAAIYTHVDRNSLPGLVVLGRGVYRYDPEAEQIHTPTNIEPAPETPKRFTLVGNIDSRTVVLTDADGKLWRAEKLR